MKISEDGNTITMRAPDNWHAHFRQENLMRALVPIFIRSGWRRRIVAEPNTVPGIFTGSEAIKYTDEILLTGIQVHGGKSFEPLPAIQITEDTTPEMVSDACMRGVKICKVYPRMVTTHSNSGVSDYQAIRPALKAAEKLGMVVQFHAEHPSEGVEGLKKEESFLQILDQIIYYCPHLRITIEHITTNEAIKWVKQQHAGVGASVTVHHLTYTVDDVLGYSKRSNGLMRVHCGCKPQPKWNADRQALIDTVIIEGDPRFFYGGDDAAHLKSKKECGASACGVWNTMAALPLLVQLFTEHGAIAQLEPFTSEFGAKFYSFGLNRDSITVIRKDWTVPLEVKVPLCNDSIVPMCAGETLKWHVEG